MSRGGPELKVERRRGAPNGAWILCSALVVVGCGDDDSHQHGVDERFAQEVISVEFGEGAGFGEDDLPGVVLGPPGGGSTTAGSLDVVSLGDGGEIVVGFGDQQIIDGPGPDFIVFENPFWPGGDPDEVYAELGEVSVSQDGETWHTFECDYVPQDNPPYDGCAGWTPTFDYDWEKQDPLDPEATGGDAFDLGDVPIEEARYVRIRDVWGLGEAPSRGFDLDAVGLINTQ